MTDGTRAALVFHHIYTATFAHMLTRWEDSFRECGLPWKDDVSFDEPLSVTSLDQLRDFLDVVHIRHCLLRPFFEQQDYPLIDSRELLPSFEGDLIEYKNLPGFCMVAFGRPMNYFQEIFQYDKLHSLLDVTGKAEGQACPLENNIIVQNTTTLQNRLPKSLHEEFRSRFGKTDVSQLEYYPALMPLLLEMDRGQVMAQDSFGFYHLAGVYASFPSDLDSEIKRFGLHIGKFAVGDNELYERNRLFVYQFLMELYGFPIVSERRTSSALFARRLHKLGEHFMVRVLGQTDRTITTIKNGSNLRHYPTVDKIALVPVEPEQTDAIADLAQGGYFVDEKRRVIILKVTYRQHKFNADNVRQERALSVERQEVIHPVTGQALTHLNIIKDTSNMFLRLNDIVRGEYSGRIIYKRNEIIENTDTDEKRLKFLYAWLSKHQRRIIGYSDEFYANVVKVLDNYLLSPDRYEVFGSMHELYQEVWSKYSYIQQARKVRYLEDIQDRIYKGERISYGTMLREAVELLRNLKFEIVSYFDQLVASVIATGESMLNDRYLVRNYIEKRDEELTEYGRDIKRLYGKLVALIDEFRAIRRSRRE
ncbi:hypothetical protein Dde_1995 [Oleidesulfovibrio alaskensis G20]|uniref:Uncharacterized protein n=2 Tax=Oleidesulfovibrio alaskensis TaxID=58180 RepID=Q30ZV4_OLEA2|nr:hypothetical protein Dde_1995 [Oleidesulfovibrio alaskensis G20]